jgi:hypothetical protein
MYGLWGMNNLQKYDIFLQNKKKKKNKKERKIEEKKSLTHT